MPFYNLIFKYDEWHDMWVKNCSLKPLEEWNKGGDHYILGTMYVTMAVIFEIIYIPFLLAMLKKDVFKNSCYKLMFTLGIFDMCALVTDAILPGIQSIQGEHFCVRPLYYYMVGGLGMGTYHCVTAICCFLAFDRFLTIVYPKAAKVLFHGWRIIIWPTLSIAYMFCFFIFQWAIVFNVNRQKFLFDPYRYTDLEGVDKRFYDHPMVYINSGMTVCVMGSLYGILCAVLYLKPKSIPTITKLQRVMLLQSFAICGEMFFVAIFYVGDCLGFPMPEIVTRYEQFVLILIHGDTPLVYLLLNATLRRQVYNDIKAYLIKGAKAGNRQVSEAASFFVTSVYPTRFRNRIANAGEFTTPNPHGTLALR